jgi:hypothetical protein
LAYVHITIRVPQPVMVQVGELAKLSGWQLADLQRTLICIGASFFFLSYGNEASEDAAATLMGGTKLLRLSRSFSLELSQRSYAFRLRFRKTTLITLSLPQSFCDLAAIYADLKHVSRNQVYNKCLHQGLLIYLKSQATILGPRGEIDSAVPRSHTS